MSYHFYDLGKNADDYLLEAEDADGIMIDPLTGRISLEAILGLLPMPSRPPLRDLSDDDDGIF